MVHTVMDAKARLLSVADGLAAHRRLIYVAARIFAVIFVAAFILQHGNWTRTQEFHGPFVQSPAVSGQYRVAIGTDIPYLSILGPLPESELKPGEDPRVRLRINGKNWDAPQAPEPAIEQSDLYGIRGLLRTLQFTLPAGVANNSSTELQVDYRIQVQRSIYEVILFGMLVLGFLAVRLAYRVGDCAWLRAISARTAPLMWTMQAASWALIVASILYVGTIVYGVTAGDALPTATVFRLIPYARSVTAIAPYAPLAILAFGALGAALAWLAWFGLVPVGPLNQLELAQARLWRIFGLPVLLCLFLFALSAGGWSGFAHVTDMNYMSIAGLVPHSDSSAYYKDTFHLAYFGDWELMGTRRPIAEAFREVITVAANYSFPGTLLVQLVMMAVMLYLASYLLAGWYGIWAGIGFAGLAFNVARPYLSTTLTEPLGYIWGLFSLIFFVQSIRQRSLPHALLGLAALTVALMMRMGALFAVPFMVLWIGYAFAERDCLTLTAHRNCLCDRDCGAGDQPGASTHLRFGRR